MGVEAEFYSFFNLGVRLGGCKSHVPAALPPGKSRCPLNKRLGAASEPVWRGAYNLAPTGIRSPDRHGRSESLYLLRSLGPHNLHFLPI